MAVLEAVRGWEYLAGLPHVGEAEKEEGSDVEDAGAGEGKQDSQEVLEEGMWSAERLDQDLDSLVGSDYVSLLLEHEEHIRSPPKSSSRELHAYSYIWRFIDCSKYSIYHYIFQILICHNTKLSKIPSSHG
jgi:protein kinase C substrate 80K-H